MRLLYGTFGLYVDNKLYRAGVFFAERLSEEDRQIIKEFVDVNGLDMMANFDFIEKLFYPEVYGLGTLCVNFNAPFDLAQVAIDSANGEGQERRRTTLTLTRRVRWPRVRIEPISGKAAFIGFAPKKHPARWEKPLFKGRFLDLSTLTRALTGERHTLRSAGVRFHADVIKSKTEDLGKVTSDSLRYAWDDVRATWALYERLRDEYLKHPFATMENERQQPADSCPMTRLFSTASVGKRYLHLFGYRPLLLAQPDFDLKYFGYASSAYFGGRAEVKIRRVDVPVTVVDFTSMYGTVFILQNLQELMNARSLEVRDCTSRTQQLLQDYSLEDLFDPNLWPLLRTLVRIRPNGDTLPVRYRLGSDAPYEISTAPFTSDSDRWYTFADVLAAKLLGGGVVETLEAVEFAPKGQQYLKTVKFQGGVALDPSSQLFKTVVEERQRAKKSGAYAQGLKQFAASAAYGINFEINVRPSPVSKPPSGMVFSDTQFHSHNIHDERPGAFCNPIIAALVTGGARLLLAMLECKVKELGGDFAFCDTDSLAIVSGDDCPDGIGSLTKQQVQQIIEHLDRLNPYDPEFVPHLLKIEFQDVRCWAISAKRYILFQKDGLKHFRILKASESGLGGIIGRSKNENTPKLARRIWLSILIDELGDKYQYQLLNRYRKLVTFAGPLRRKLPLAQPEILKRFEDFNRSKDYTDRVKPFSFLQTVIVTTQRGDEVRPVAPFERDLGRSKKLVWIDAKTGKPVQLDWLGTGHAGTVPVMSLAEFVKAYATHPEAKASGPDRNPCTRETRGVLGRLQLLDGKPIRIGKEIDRLFEDEDMTLDDRDPIAYDNEGSDTELEAALKVLQDLPQSTLAAEIGISERRLRDIERHRASPRRRTRDAILRLAKEVREGTRFDGSRSAEAASTMPVQAVGEAWTQGNGYAGPIIFACFVLFVIIMAVMNKGSQE